VVNLIELVRAQGIYPQTEYQWFREGTLPDPAVRVNQCTVLVSPVAPTEPGASSYGLYARVSSHDQKADLDRRVAWLTSWATDAGGQVVRVGAGMKGSRAKVFRPLADPDVTAVVVEHRDRLGRMNTEKAVGCTQRDIGPQAVFAETVGGRGQDVCVMTKEGARWDRRRGVS
jgi:putative resolvase